MKLRARAGSQETLPAARRTATTYAPGKGEWRQERRGQGALPFALLGAGSDFSTDRTFMETPSIFYAEDRGRFHFRDFISSFTHSFNPA